MADALFGQLKERLPGVVRNEPLKRHTTFKIGGPARYFFVATGPQEVMAAARAAKELQLPLFAFGGGSNLLVADRGFDGLVVKLQAPQKLKLRVAADDMIEIPAGLPLKQAVDFAVSKGLAGLEWAGGLPGTFGGAVRGNAGAFGGEMKDSVASATALDDKLRVRRFTRRQCHFSYRSSVFKEKSWTVISATVKLSKGKRKELQAIAGSHEQYRKERHPMDLPNAGSMFKNVPFSQVAPSLRESLKAVVKRDPFPVVPTAYLLSELGLKGTKIGGAQISPKHPNFIVNLGRAHASDVVALLDMAKQKAKERYGVALETEVQFVGF